MIYYFTNNRAKIVTQCNEKSGNETYTIVAI